MSRFLMVAVLLASGVTAATEKASPKAVEQPLPVFHAQFPVRIPLPIRTRIYVKPEAVGVDKACPFPTVKDPVCFQCPQCGLKMKTHVLYPHLPHCPKDRWVMNEIEKW
jgi:hypothetical protein